METAAEGMEGDVTPSGVTGVLPTLSPMSDLMVPEGAPARFVTSFTGVPAPTIIWLREGNQLKPSRDFQVCNHHDVSCDTIHNNLK